jgi:hypothetical protein
LSTKVVCLSTDIANQSDSITFFNKNSMDDESRIKSPKSKSSHGSWAPSRQHPTEPRSRTLKNLTLFLPKLLKEVGKTGKMNFVKFASAFLFGKYPLKTPVLYKVNSFMTFLKISIIFRKKIFSSSFSS